ncbi:response regulator [Azospirillum doebereinerae]|uniref:Regulatory protein VirG n=1 Tax=Azospirillum doebereinerae TaxID=92933 RepID=A0A3S0WWG6_9PROT|nr:response regulator [Azospirillum doebereinerae]MCG5243168.1 response regulator [Azospirillum doebereinerae]RUQ73853.1 response regulator [Azospirillum doebereinerae]
MDRTPHLLVVDDDREIRSLVAQFLTKHGFRVTGVKDGAEMMRTLDGARVDLIVLDLMLPGEDGLSLCRRLRASAPTAQTPVIMLTAMGEETDRIVGLEMGADDYLAKPFSPRELLARIKAVLRRVSAPPVAGTSGGGTVLRFEGWSLDVTKRELRSPDGVLVQLSAGEYDLLVAFAEHPQRVLNRDQLLDLARGRSAVPFDRSVDVQVSRLRRKIEPDPAEPTLIKTVRGGGYLFTPTVSVGS